MLTRLTAWRAPRPSSQLPVSRIDEVLGFDRVVFIPSVAVTLKELEDATRRVVKPHCHSLLGKVGWCPVPPIDHDPAAP